MLNDSPFFPALKKSKRFGPIACCALLCLIATSACISKYRTVIPNEALFTTRPEDKKVLGASGAPYMHKESDQLKSSEETYEPRESETYAQFKMRVANTFALQSYEQQQLLQALARTKHSVAELESQIGLLKGKYVSLRMEYADLTLEERSDIAVFTLFQRYQIKPGDTLQNIAKQNYHTNRAWLGLYRFNLDRLPNGPNRLHPGQWIVLPNINLEQSVRAHQARRKAATPPPVAPSDKSKK